MSTDLIWSSARGRSQRAALGPDLASFPPAEEAPPSDAQARLVALDALHPGGTAQNLAFGYRLRGRLDAAALEQALARVWARHQGLRGYFPAAGVQRFHPLESWCLERSAGSGGLESARARARGLVSAPFDLRRDELFRAGLYAIDDDDHLLALVAHHAVFDAWSLHLLHRELSLAYADPGAALPPLRTSYAQYAAWQRARLADPAVAEPLLAYWAQYLDGRPGLASFAATGGGARAPGPRRRLSRKLPPADVSRLSALASELGASLFAALFAAFAMLVAERTGELDFVVLTPSAGRIVAPLHDLVGYFVELHPLRADLREAPDFAALVARCALGLAGAAEHQEVPARMAASLYGSAPGAAPLMFGLQNVPARPLELRGVEVTEERLDACEADVGLYVNVVPERGGALRVEATYDGARYDDGWVASLLEGFGRGGSPPASAAGGVGSGVVLGSTQLAGGEPPRRPSPPRGGPAVVAYSVAGVEAGPLGCLARHVADLAGTPVAALDLDRGVLELGLDSLKLIELAGRVRDELEIDAPLQAYASAPSLRSLADDLLLLEIATRVPSPDGAEEVFRL